MNRLMVFILISIFSLNSFATECSSPVKLLEEGSPAPCRGYLFSPEKELDIRIKLKEYTLFQEEIAHLNSIVDKLEKTNKQYDKILELQEQKTELWKSRAVDITLKYTEVEQSRTKRDMGFTFLGIALTVLAGWSIGQAAGR